MSALTSLLPGLKKAIGVVESFTGSAATARTSSTVQDAIQVIGAVVPLFQQFGAGNEVTPDDVRAALGNNDRALADFDAEIARQEQNPDN
jgi:hypothetical protein